MFVWEYIVEDVVRGDRARHQTGAATGVRGLIRDRTPTPQHVSIVLTATRK